nr:hypothetical protein [Tanacetum cinerariifolium]
DTHQNISVMVQDAPVEEIAFMAIEEDLDDNWDIVSADFDDSSVYSISEGEGDTHQNISVMVQDAPVEEIAFMAIEEDLDDNWDIVSADFDDSSVYSISEGEGDTHQNISVMVQDAPVEEIAFMAIEEDLDDNWDIVSADFDDSSVYSISEGEGDTHQNISVMVQ